MNNYKYIPLDTNSLESEDNYEDSTLLKKNNKIKNDNNYDSDLESVLINFNNETQNIANENKKIKYNMYSRNIIIIFFITQIITACTFILTVFGGFDYYNSNLILYGSYGALLFKYYYIINICEYIIFIIFSIYLTLYIIFCIGLCHSSLDIALCYPKLDITFFNMLKINIGIFAINIILKIIYGISIICLTNNNLEISIMQIPKYYNCIIIENILYFIIQIINIFFVNIINNLINFYYTIN